MGPELSRQACPPLCLFSFVFQRYGFTSMFFPFLLLNTCYLLFLLLSLSLSLSLSYLLLQHCLGIIKLLTVRLQHTCLFAL